MASLVRPSSSNPEPTPRNALLEQFRGEQKKVKVHPAERRVMWLIAVHIIFLSWALGGMRPWANWISLGLSVVTLGLALLPRDYTEEHTGGNRFRLVMWPKLVRFPIFWIGIALLVLLAIQGLNPSWTYKTDGKSWWMQGVDHVKWLPSGVDVPLHQSGPWRMMVIYGSIWLTVCSLWVAVTRRRTIQTLALIIAGNGLALATLGIVQKFVSTSKIFWFVTPPPRAFIFASFIYKNHAGAFLFLSLIVTCGIAGWYYIRGLRRLEKSTPSGVFAFFATCIAVSIVASYARGATLTAMAFLLVVAIAFLAHQIFLAPETGRRWTVIVVAVVLFGLFARTGYEALRLGESWQRIARGLGGNDVSFNSRMIANQASAEMLRDHWKLGIGAAGFSYLFPAYQQHYPEIYMSPWDKNRRQYWSHAHNDILQIPMELGIPGMLLVAAAWGYWIVTLLRRYFWSNPLSLLLVFGAVLFVGYSYFDFPFYCPAVLMLWCCLWPIAAIWAKLEESGSR